MSIYDLDFQNCSQVMRDKCLDKLHDLLYVISETWSEEDELSLEDEFHEILSELLYKYLCFINAGASGDVKKIDKPYFNLRFSLFSNSFLDDEFQIDVDPDSHVCDYSPDGICCICGAIKYDSLTYCKLNGTDSKLDYPF